MLHLEYHFLLRFFTSVYSKRYFSSNIYPPIKPVPHPLKKILVSIHIYSLHHRWEVRHTCKFPLSIKASSPVITPEHQGVFTGYNTFFTTLIAVKASCLTSHIRCPAPSLAPMIAFLVVASSCILLRHQLFSLSKSLSNPDNTGL